MTCTTHHNACDCREEMLAERIAKLETALHLIASPQRPDGTWNRDREACRVIAQEALDE